MNRIFGLILLALLLLVSTIAQTQLGTAPRPTARAYPAHSALQDASLGAQILTEEEVRKSFVSDLGRRYAVVEVAVYPDAGKDIEVARTQYVLRIEQVQIRPEDPRLVAAMLQKSATGGRNINIHPQVGVGYESGPCIYDPVSGTSRGGGVHTSVGVGVGVGGPSPGPSPADRRTMELELTEKSLVEGKTAHPAAGYLYFPLPEKRKSATYQLEHTLNGKTALLRLAHSK